MKKILFWCNRDGLFSVDVVKGIDDRDRGYDDTEERRTLEKEADYGMIEPGNRRPAGQGKRDNK